MLERINWKEKLMITAALAALIGLMYMLQLGCPFLRVTGVPCPGCGMTRAALSLLQGDMQGALRHHGMVWSLPVIYLIFLCDGQVFRARWMNAVLLGLLGLGFLTNWLLRLT